MLFLTGLTAGFVDSIAGGGGLIALPAILSAGVPPHLALGTNKLQGSFGTLAASVHFIRKGAVNLKDILPGIGFTFTGAVAGSWAIQRIHAGFLKPLIPFMLLLVFVYTLRAKDLGRSPIPPKMGRPLFFMIFGLGLGFYDGFFGPGTGSFWTGALLVFLGMDMTSSTGTTRIMNFTSNGVALCVFIIGGNVLWQVGLTMAAGQVIGARIGSGMAIRRGAAFIRPIFLTMVFLTILRLIYTGFPKSMVHDLVARAHLF
jgi:uncharacterized membrane protein YfcA